MLVVAIAAFLPWASIFGIGVQGIEGDGQVTVVCAIVGLALLLVGTRSSSPNPKPVLRVLSYVAAAITTLVGLVDMNGVAAIGLYLTLFGGVGWLAALVWDGMERKKTALDSGEVDPPVA